MIKDLELMKNISPLFEKQLVLWGMGEFGRTILKDIVEMGAGKKGLFLCDSDKKLWGGKMKNLKMRYYPLLNYKKK